MAEAIMYFAIMGLVALIMVGIGASQLRSREPVSFYTGVKPPEKRELRDVKAWNQKHGRMWIIYGAAIMGGGLAQMIAGLAGWNDVFMMILEIFIVIGGVFVMMWYHMRLEKRYRL